MVTEECALVILSLQSTNGECNQADSKNNSESDIKKIAWAEHTSLSHSKIKSLSRSKSKSFSQLKRKDLPCPDSKSHTLMEPVSTALSQSSQKIVTFFHPEKRRTKPGSKNVPLPEKHLARPETRNTAQPGKSPTYPGTKGILQTINKSHSLSELGGDEGGEALPTLMDQVY